jgi:hypothetical protein
MSTLREQILQADDRPVEELWVPEWNLRIYLRTMSAGERDAFGASNDPRLNGGKQADYATLRARFCALVIVDESGERIFSAGDIEALSAKSATAIDRIWEAASKLNRMAEEDIGELAKNS